MIEYIDKITSAFVFSTISDMKNRIDQKYIRKFVWVHPTNDTEWYDESEAIVDGLPVRLGSILYINNEEILCIDGMGIILHNKQPIKLLKNNNDFIQALCDVTKMYLTTINSPEFAD